MANQLKMAKVNSILTLRARGWSCRRIARELGVHRETVGRYVRRAEEEQNRPNPLTGSEPAGGSKPANVLTESEARDGPEPANPLTGSDEVSPPPPGPASACEGFREEIVEKLEAGLTAQRIYQDLTAEHAFRGSYSSVQRFTRRLRERSPRPFRRMECAPGDEAQVDFGTGAPIVGTSGRRRRTHLFHIVLSHSRKGYSEVVFRQTTEEFIRCLENAFRHFGGAPKTLVLDNLKAGVTHADWYDPELNPKLQAFCEHYGVVALPTKPYTPRHKGKVERGVGYVQSNALKGRSFPTLAAQNEHLREWETGTADTRIHGTTRCQVKNVFEEIERPALQPLPVERFPFFHEATRKVHRDGHVEIDKAFYSVPPEYVGHTVWARWDGHLVRIFDRRMRPIAVHVKHEAGRFSTTSEHIHPEKVSAVERGAGDLLQRTSYIGAHTQRWARSMLDTRGIEGVRVLVGLHSLARQHTSAVIEQACEIAQSHGAYRLREIRQLIKRQGAKQEQFEFMEAHDIIRNLGEYTEAARRAIRHADAASTSAASTDT